MRVVESGCALGESPLSVSDTLYWVDAERGDLHSLRDGRHTREHVTDGLLAAVSSTLYGELVYVIDRQILLASGWVVAELPDDPPGVRCNDAKVGPDGRLWTGTVLRGTPAAGALWSVGLDGSVTRHRDGVSHGNGLAWAPDGRTLYFVDSGAGTLTRSAFPDGRPEVVLRMDPADGIPDGLTVDETGHLWLAVWGGSCLLRLDPNGAVVDRLELPSPNVTSCAFHSGRLAVTTAAPDGALHLLDVGVDGLPGYRFGSRS